MTASHDNVTDIVERVETSVLQDGITRLPAEDFNTLVSTIAKQQDDLTKLRKQLEDAREALREYACHAGPSAPCTRPPHQCEQECGKIAGDAFWEIEESLKGQP